MADWANISGQRIVSCSLTIPYWGTWVADLLVALDTTLASQVTLTLGDATFVGNIVRQGPYGGALNARVVGGFGGWAATIPAQSYGSSGGVMTSMVLNDAAALVGEKVVLYSDSNLGSFFVRELAPAQRVLSQLAGELWWMGLDGLTNVGVPRDGSLITSPFEVIDRNTAKGVIRISTEKVTDWQPGRTFNAPGFSLVETIASVTHQVGTEGVHRVDLLTTDAGAATVLATDPTAKDRTMRGFRELVRSQFPFMTYSTFWSYTVVNPTATTIDAVTSDARVPLPELTSVPLLPSVLGENATFASGAACIVTFVNGDPSRPVVVGGDYSNPPTHAKLMGGGLKAARVTDPVLCGYIVLIVGGAGVPGTIDPGPPVGYYPGTTAGLAAATARVSALNSTPGTATLLTLDGGHISDGSNKLEIG